MKEFNKNCERQYLKTFRKSLFWTMVDFDVYQFLIVSTLVVKQSFQMKEDVFRQADSREKGTAEKHRFLRKSWVIFTRILNALCVANNILPRDANQSNFLKNQIYVSFTKKRKSVINSSTVFYQWMIDPGQK